MTATAIPVPGQVAKHEVGFEHEAFRIWMNQITAFANALSVPITSVSAAAYTVLPTDRVIFVDATGGNRVLTLYAANLFGAAFSPSLRIKRIDSSANTVTIQRAGGDTVDNAVSCTLAALQSKDFNSDGVSHWYIT